MVVNHSGNSSPRPPSASATLSFMALRSSRVSFTSKTRSFGRLFVIVSWDSGSEADSAEASEAAPESTVLAAPMVVIARNSRRFIVVRTDTPLLYCTFSDPAHPTRRKMLDFLAA